MSAAASYIPSYIPLQPPDRNLIVKINNFPHSHYNREVWGSAPALSPLRPPQILRVMLAELWAVPVWVGAFAVEGQGEAYDIEVAAGEFAHHIHGGELRGGDEVGDVVDGCAGDADFGEGGHPRIAALRK